MPINHKAIPHAYRTLEALSNIGYSFESAVSDLIDNCIDAKANNILIYFDFIKSKNYNLEFRIFDDGHGIAKDDLGEAMTLGTDSSKGDEHLGKYGFGMKTASLSQCKKLSVITKKNTAISNLTYDMEFIAKTDKWELLEKTDEELAPLIEKESNKLQKMFIKNFKTTSASFGDFFYNHNSFTLVIWDKIKDLQDEINKRTKEKYKIDFFEKQKNDLIDYIELYFHRYLSGENVKKIKININGQQLQPNDPFCRDEEHTLSSKKDEALKMPYQCEMFDIFRYKEDSKLGYKGVDESKLIEITRYILPTNPNRPGKCNFSSKNAWDKSASLSSQNDAQGYYIYRENRLICFGGWFGVRGKDEHIKIARASIDLKAIHDKLFSVTVDKSKIKLPKYFKNFLGKELPSNYFRLTRARYDNNEGGKRKIRNSFTNKKNKVHSVQNELLNNDKIKFTEEKNNLGHNVINVSNSYGSYKYEDVHKILDSSLVINFEKFDEVDAHKLWKTVPSPSVFQVIVNENHPIYDKIYSGDEKENKHAQALMHSFFFTLSFIELKCKSDRNKSLFDDINKTAYDAFKKLIEESIF